MVQAVLTYNNSGSYSSGISGGRLLDLIAECDTC